MVYPPIVSPTLHLCLRVRLLPSPLSIPLSFAAPPPPPAAAVSVTLSSPAHVSLFLSLLLSSLFSPIARRLSRYLSVHPVFLPPSLPRFPPPSLNACMHASIHPSLHPSIRTSHSHTLPLTLLSPLHSDCPSLSSLTGPSRPHNGGGLLRHDRNPCSDLCSSYQGASVCSFIPLRVSCTLQPSACMLLLLEVL